VVAVEVVVGDVEEGGWRMDDTYLVRRRCRRVQLPRQPWAGLGEVM